LVVATAECYDGLPTSSSSSGVVDVQAAHRRSLGSLPCERISSCDVADVEDHVRRQ
jgi:hypothetical protein